MLGPTTVWQRLLSTLHTKQMAPHACQDFPTASWMCITGWQRPAAQELTVDAAALGQVVVAAVGAAVEAVATSGWASRRSSDRRCRTGVRTLLCMARSKHISNDLSCENPAAGKRGGCAAHWRHCSSVILCVTVHLQAGRQVRGLPPAAQQRLLRHDRPQQVPCNFRTPLCELVGTDPVQAPPSAGRTCSC
jgi:hypothetical protein